MINSLPIKEIIIFTALLILGYVILGMINKTGIIEKLDERGVVPKDYSKFQQKVSYKY